LLQQNAPNTGSRIWTLEGPTAVLAVIGVIAVFFLRPGTALALLATSALFWPDFLRFSIGPIQMSVSRAIALAIIFNSLRARSYRSRSPDGFVLFLWLWIVFAKVSAGSQFGSISTAIGQGLDTVAVYFAARMSLRSTQDFRDVIRLLPYVTVVIGSLAFVEAVTAWSPWDSVSQFGAFTSFDGESEFRLGLKRASGAAAIYIHFGVAVALIFAIQLSLFRLNGVRLKPLRLGLFSCMVGVFSSLSSGPWLMTVIYLGLTWFYGRQHLIKPIVYFFVGSIVLMELFSNRHFYHLVDYLALDKSTAWYRARLIEVSFQRLGEWWLFGVGDKSLLDWAAEIDGRDKLDMVNQYLLYGINAGLPAMCTYVIIQIKSFHNGLALARSSVSDVRFLGFSYCATVLALGFCLNTVSAFGPALIVSWVLYGMLPTFTKDTRFRQLEISAFSNSQDLVRDHN
jgi:hypothetical protein